jgi:nucleotide-binding universal stress UspA family protein
MDSIKKILVPIDFSENSSSILQSAFPFAEKFSASIFILYVIEDLYSLYRFSIPHISFDELEKEMMASAETKMENFLEKNMNTTIPFKSKIGYGHVADEILQTAGDEGIDLIIMGTHGYKGIEKVFLGSVAEKVVRSASCPVLTLRP